MNTGVDMFESKAETEAETEAESAAETEVKIESDYPQPMGVSMLSNYNLDNSEYSFGQINPRDYLIQDEQGQTKIFRYNKNDIRGLDGQIMAANGQTILSFPSTRQLIGHQYQPWNYQEQYSHPCKCYPRKRALDIIGSNTELPRVCHLCSCNYPKCN
jgi:hypothetical protein